MNHFAYRGGALHAEDVDLARIAREIGTPFYCYSSATIERHFHVFSSAFADSPALVCYAMKANSNQAVLTTLARMGAGMDVVSEGELRRARAAGVPADKIIFSGVGKTRAEMALALEEDILLLQRRIRAGARGALRDRLGARQNRAHRHSRQSGRRRAHARQDLHGQVGKQVRHSDLPRARRLCPRARPARPRRIRRRHAHRLADHRHAALRRRLRAARRFRARVAQRRPCDRSYRSRRRPRHPLSLRQRAASSPQALR